MVDEKEFQEFLKDFLIESSELLDEYERNLLEIETILRLPDFKFEMIKDHMQAIFRSIHTIKSLSGMLDFNEIKNYTHKAEDFLHLARSNQVPFSTETIALFFEILDTTKKLVDFVRTNSKITINLDAKEKQISDFINGQIYQQDNEIIAGSAVQEKIPEVVAPKKKQEQANTTTIRVDTSRLDALLDTVGEIVIGKNRLRETNKIMQDYLAGHDNSKYHRQLEQLKGNLNESVDSLTNLIVNLQEFSMKLRMVPIGYTLKKFKRLVRDLAIKHEKKIQFIIEGENTEVDRAVIEAMEDPLLHLIRNSIDHGIEKPDERKWKNKPEEGTLKISAAQENNAIVIQISDDGRGIDQGILLNKAIDAGLVDENAVLSEKEIINLIFLPGLSTASKVTEVSGRGVGMDVVKKNLLQLNGMIDVKSETGKGTTFTLILPLTLAIIRVLLVKIGAENFAIPFSNVIETLQMPIEEIQLINGQSAIQLRDQILPVVYLDQLLSIASTNHKEKIYIVVTGMGETRAGFVVDSLLDQQDIVIKPLGDYINDVHGIAGATILGDGNISLVLDMPSLWQDVIKMITV